MRISVGPAPCSWGEEKLTNFYQEIAESPADDVYLGEVVCAKRSCLSPEMVSHIARALAHAGKTLYLSSPALVTNQEERREFDLLWRHVKCVEINSTAFLATARSRPAVAGAFLNVYNSSAARMLGRLGVVRVVFPSEISREPLESLVKRSGLKVEVVVHGHIPIALSRNCHTARALMRDERSCGAACRRFP